MNFSFKGLTIRGLGSAFVRVGMREWRTPKVEMQCHFTSLSCGTDAEQCRNFNGKIASLSETFTLKFENNHSFPIIFRKHTQDLAPNCDVTHDTGDNFSSSFILLFSSGLHNNVYLREKSDFEMEFDILLHEHQPFDCVLQFGNARCDVTSEQSRQM